MSVKISKQAKMGLHFLKESVSEILYNSQDEGPLQPEEITKRLNLNTFDEPSDRHNALVINIISYLQSEGRISYITGNGGGWVITEEETSRLRNYIKLRSEIL